MAGYSCALNIWLPTSRKPSGAAVPKRRVDAVDSILPERALRELYLLPFEMLVRQADVRCIATSFNKINGVFAGGKVRIFAPTFCGRSGDFLERW